MNPDLARHFLLQPNLSKEDFLLIFDKYLPSPSLPDALIAYLKKSAPPWPDHDNTSHNEPYFSLRDEYNRAHWLITGVLAERPLTARQLLQILDLLSIYKINSDSTREKINSLLLKTPEAQTIIKQLSLQFVTLSSKNLSSHVFNKVMAEIKTSVSGRPELA